MIKGFERQDLERMEIHESQAWIRPYLTNEVYECINLFPDAFTLVKEGKPVACAGLIPEGSGVAKAWAFFSVDAGKYMFEIAKTIMWYLPKLKEYNKITAAVDSNFEGGRKFMELLKFKYEQKIIGFFPNGSDAEMYRRVL